MRLFRFGAAGNERPGVATDGRHLDVSEFTADFDEAFFAANGIAALAEWLREPGRRCPEIEAGKVRFGAVVARPSKIVAVGLNYRAHAEETGARVPSEPMLFMKATTAMCGVFDDVVLPVDSEHTDHEVELALVVGALARRVRVDHALDHVAGFTVCNDYSERDHQKNRGGQFVKGKSADTFAPLGPYLVPARDLDPGDLRLWLSVNGDMRQDASTADMIFDVPTIVSRVSHYMTLLPGDVITTGTPSGVGMGFDPPRFLRAGDRVRYGIDGIGEADQRVVAAREHAAAD